MHKYVIIHQSPVFNANWLELYNPDQYKMIMITSEKCLADLSKKEEKVFDAIYKTESFDLISLSNILEEKILNGHSDNYSIVTNAEYPQIVCAELREKYSIAGNTVEEILPFRDKVIMKNKLKNVDHYLPKYLKFSKMAFIKNKMDYVQDVVSKLSLPIFIKPISHAGSINTQKINSKESLLAWCEGEHGENDFELDEYITGDLFHIDSIVKNGKIIFSQTCKDLYPCFDFLLGSPNASIMLREDNQDVKTIQKINREVLSILKAPDGITHLEVFKTFGNRFLFLEVAARPPGGLIPQMYKKSLGIDCTTLHYKLQMGLDVNLHVKQRTYAAWAWFPRRRGVVKQIVMPSDIKSKHTFTPLIKIGDKITDSGSLLDISARLFIWNDSYEQLLKDFNSLKDFSPLILE